MLPRFLELFAPQEGARAVCLSEPGHEPRRATMCRSSQELAAQVLRARQHGFNAWISLACFTGTRRSGKESTDLRIIGVDIDFKPGEVPTFADKAEALRFTAQSEQIGLPLPTFTIDSGHGIHLWYVLDKPLARQQWVDVASAMWAALGSLHTGFITDPSRKTDTAGLLRLPMTTNTKKDMDPVPCGFVGGEWEHLSTSQTIDIDTLLPVLRRFGSIAAVLPPPTVGKAYAPIAFRPKTEVDLSVPSMVPVVGACRVLQHAYAHQEDADYNAWWPVIAACAWAGDGREVAHAMSRQHPNYQWEMVDKKFDDFADGDSLPPSCTYLANAVMGDDSACLDCAARLTGRKWPHQHPDLLRLCEPITVVEQVVEPTTETQQVSPDGAETPPQTPISPPQTPISPGKPENAPAVPVHVTDTGSRFYATSDYRMVMKSKNDEGEPTILQIADHAIWGERFVYNPIEQRMEIVFGTARYDRARALVIGEVQVPARAISGDWSAMAAPFADAGIALAAVQPKTKNALKEYLLFEQSRVRDEDCVEQVAHHGWQKDNGFATGGLVYAPNGRATTARLTASAKAHEQRFSRRGSADEQKAMVGLYGQHGSDLAKFVVGLSAGSPAHGLRDKGGVLAALVGRTAMGKTALTEFAASFWGRPDMLLITPASTVKSMYELIGTARNLPSWIDEVTFTERDQLVDMIHQISGGGGRGALNRNGEARAVEAVPTWASTVTWTSNASIVGQLRGISDANQAVAARVFELKVSEGTLAIEDKLRLAALRGEYKDHCGHVGVMLGEMYARDRARVIEAHKAALTAVEDMVPGGATGAYRYWAQALQTFETGAAALHDMGLWVMDQNERKRVALAMAQRAMLEAEKVEYGATEAVRTFVNANIERMISMEVGAKTAVGDARPYVPTQTAVGRLEKDSDREVMRVRLNKEAFERWLRTKDSTLDAVLAQAGNEKILRPDALEVTDLYAGCTRLDRASGVASGAVEAPAVTFWLPMRVDQLAAARSRRQG